jgi:hypothetical protein
MARQVEVERSGGFAGLTSRSSVSEAELSTAELDALLQLVQRFRGRRSQGQQGATPDRFQYDVVVSGEGPTERATVWEQELTPGERELLAGVIQRRGG